MGLALLVLQLFVIGVLSLDVLYGFADSRLMIVGLPLATFFISLGFLSHRSRLSLPESPPYAESLAFLGFGIEGALLLLTPRAA